MLHIQQTDEVLSPTPAQNEQYQNYIVKYNPAIHGPIEGNFDGAIQVVDNLYAILYIPEEDTGGPEIDGYSYNTIPKCFTYLDLESLAASGVLRLHNHPYLALRGRGTLVAIIDSGIDYTHPVFRDVGFGVEIPEEGLPGTNVSKILALWDQTVPGDFRSPENGIGFSRFTTASSIQQFAPYGKVYSNAEINQALAAEDPFSVVPSRDENGHGTMLAATAAGRLVASEGFSGAAPEASLIVVKLRQAKQYLRDFYLYPDGADVYQEDDIMLGISFAIQCANYFHMPLSICIGLGSSQGAHLGQGALSQYLNAVNGFSQNVASIAAGNEGAARHHFGGTLETGESSRTVELRVGEDVEGFTMEFWGETPEDYLVSLQSPIGESLEICTSLGPGTQELTYVFVETQVLVNFVPVERETGYTLIYFRFIDPAAGIWRFLVQGRGNRSVTFHMWLPVQGLIDRNTFFLESSPYTTITSPGDAVECLTLTAYRARDNSLFLEASRGFLPDGTVKPTLALPGVEEKVALVGGGYGIASGTSLAAAQCAGIGALLFEWALVRENEPFYNGNNVKYDLIRGAVRDENRPYPNTEWGYGRVDLYRSFELL